MVLGKEIARWDLKITKKRREKERKKEEEEKRRKREERKRARSLDEWILSKLSRQKDKFFLYKAYYAKH